MTALLTTSAFAASPPPSPPAEARAVVAFWRDAGPKLWFAKDAAFDARFRERKLEMLEDIYHRNVDLQKPGPDPVASDQG